MPQQNEADVVTLGESMVLFQSMGDRSLMYESTFTKSLAGAESNVAIGLSRLGKKVRWISSLGTDPFGDFVMATLAGEGVDTTHVIRDEDAPTSVYFKDLKAYADPNVYYYRKHSAASRLHPGVIRSEWFDGAKHFHVTGITPAIGKETEETVRQAMILAHEKGLTISFDPNLRRKLWSAEKAREVLLSFIPLCDIYLPGIEEAQFLLGDLPVEEYGERFLAMGPKIVALKLGEEGAIGFTTGHSVKVPPFKIDHVVDTVGAGDSFAAGLLSVLLDSLEQLRTGNIPAEVVIEALERANTLGALATQFKGDWEGAPRLKELKGIMNGKPVSTR
ncbi:sugar kinase [Jeotgalibacillus soli]|uniref:Carbohydrate kinase PfkB domain-containing protein n=1 Tax=Jeotgalibacillus soli TaxID=889306 RepID=A0A0C2W6D9_9BACL|nr:sugar kinase [Jeotgalibacillus soli]KIL52141.1 hypothetical protein KP78_05110 [Jeotgalibacillus soli]